MGVARQLTVGWQNRPGELANFCEALATAKVNILALATAEAGEYGAVRLLVDDVEQAREVFHERGVAHTSIEVLTATLGSNPGGSRTTRSTSSISTPRSRRTTGAR